MKYIYTKKNLDLISWERIDSFIDKIYKDVNNYLKSNNLSIEECNKLGINYNLVSVYPWENIEEELDELNNS